MNFLEKDLEDIIWESDKEKLDQRGLPIYGKLIRQLNIKGYGIADLVEWSIQKDPYSRTLNVTIYELKKDKIGISALMQSIYYARGIQRYLEFRLKNLKFTINIVLIGSSLDLTGSFCYLPDLICNDCSYGLLNTIQYYTYDYKIDGIYFEQSYGYISLSEEFGGYNG